MTSQIFITESKDFLKSGLLAKIMYILNKMFILTLAELTCTGLQQILEKKIEKQRTKM